MELRTVDNRSIVKRVGRKRVAAEGSTFPLGNWDIECCEPIPEEEFKSGRIFMSSHCGPPVQLQKRKTKLKKQRQIANSQARTLDLSAGKKRKNTSQKLLHDPEVIKLLHGRFY